MLGEYGYMEEGKLGKPYNYKLLKRLVPYAIPYKKTVAAALFLTVLTTLFDLAVPYLSKIAIDKYILATWYRVDVTRFSPSDMQGWPKKYGHLLHESRDKSSCYISQSDINRIDPVELHAYRRQGILLHERFYRTSPDSHAFPSVGKGAKDVHTMADGSAMIPYSLLNALPNNEILQIRGKDIRGVALVGLIFLLFLSLSFGISYAEYYLLELTGQNIMQDIRLMLFRRIQSQALGFFDRNPVGRLVTRVANDIENLNEMFKSVFITVFKDFFLLCGILIVLLYLNWRLALVSFALLPFIFGLTFLFSTMAREAFRELRSTIARINAFLQERITGMRVIQLFVRERFQMKLFAEVNHENYLAGMRQIRVFAIFMPVIELLSSFAVALLIWYGGRKVIGEQLSLGALVAFISYVQIFFKPIRDISEKYNIMQSAMASTERIFEFMDHEEEIVEPKNPLAPSVTRGHIVFKQVSFAYNEGNPVLKDISFEVKPGETVAIVGPTGSGKTTLVNLVERFYDPGKGAILMDNVDLRNWPKRQLRKSFGLCMQDAFIFAGSMADNISLGREGLTAVDIELAAEQANAVPFIKRLNGGFGRAIGERGSTISAGERQLLSFARALAANPSVLILDEATSNVDPETERLIREAISRITAERTTLVVAHRLSTIREADRILVMNKGRIIEQGTHQELLGIGGIYFELNKLGEN